MRKPLRDNLQQAFALAVLLVLTGFTIFGPTGLLAWRENADLLEQRRAQVAELEDRRESLRNRVDLLDPEGADPDLVSELAREELGVLHPDEIIITLPEE